jgi:apolipoprotein N-acyltransferase
MSNFWENFWLKFNRFYGPPILSGLLLVLSFPKIDLFFLAWIGLMPLFLHLYGKEKKEAFISGLIFGFIYFFGTIYWIYYALNQYGNITFFVSLLIIGLLSLYLALYPALFSIFYSRYSKNPNLPILLIAPIFWVVTEYLRSYLLTGFSWSTLGYSQYKLLNLIQISDITGVYGISFLIVAFNGALTDLFLIKAKLKERPLYSIIPTVGGFILLFFILTLSFYYGTYRLNQERDGSIFKASIIQGNIEQDRKWEPIYQREVIDTYKELSFSASKENPDLIVWPETAVPFYFGRDILWTSYLLDFHKELNSYLLFGSVLVKFPDQKSEIHFPKGAKAPLKPEKDISLFGSLREEVPQSATENPIPFYTNSAVLLDKNGKTAYVYDKIHLVPFGEYVPLKRLLFFVDKLTHGVGDYTPGRFPVTAITPFGNFGTLICYEIIFPGLVRKFFTKDGDFIVTITNDAWFGKTSGPYQHFSMSVFRAIENRKPVIRAANTGISGFIDSNGRIISHTKLFERTILSETIKTDRYKTFYTRYGDIFSYLCFVCTVLIIIKGEKRR